MDTHVVFYLQLVKVGFFFCCCCIFHISSDIFTSGGWHFFFVLVSTDNRVIFSKYRLFLNIDWTWNLARPSSPVLVLGPWLLSGRRIIWNAKEAHLSDTLHTIPYQNQWWGNRVWQWVRVRLTTTRYLPSLPLLVQFHKSYHPPTSSVPRRDTILKHLPVQAFGHSTLLVTCKKIVFLGCLIFFRVMPLFRFSPLPTVLI